MSEGLIGVLIGGAITFFSGFYIERKKQKKEEIKFKREKLEALYSNYLNWEKHINKFYTMHVFLNEGEIDLSTFNDLVSSDSMNNIYNQTITILNLYFIDLKDKYNAMDLRREELIQCLSIKNLKFNNQELNQAYSYFTLASENFKKAIADEIHKI